MSKICPIMSRPIHKQRYESFGYIIGDTTHLLKVKCLREECEAWNCEYGYCKLIEEEANQ